jgi:DNA-binding transcriptional LysR family regulator
MSKLFEQGSAMRHNNWADLAIFAVIAEENSFTKAAQRMDVSTSALSHAMRSMEERLGVRLLNRTTRSMALTDAGAQLLLRLKPAMGEIEQALEALNVERDHPAGRVRVCAQRTVAMHGVVQRMAKFGTSFPDVTVELVVEDGPADLSANRYDAGIRPEQKLEQDMISVRVGHPGRNAIVGAPAYFSVMPAPTDPHDIRRHRCLNLREASSGAIIQWHFEREGEAFAMEAPGVFVTNDTDVILEAALSGVGLACLPQSTVERHLGSGALVRVLEGFCPVLPASQLYYPSGRQMSAAFRAFVDAMKA